MRRPAHTGTSGWQRRLAVRAASCGGRPEITFSIPIRVYFQDTDAGGVVYHGTYLDFLERARTDWLRSLGFEQRDLARHHGMLFIVRALEVDFLRPARLDDLVSVSAEVARLGRAQVTLQQEVCREQQKLVRANVNLACVAPDDFRPLALPEPVRAVLAREPQSAITVQGG